MRPSVRASSYSYVTNKGYRRVLVWDEARQEWHQRFQHDLVWEKRYGQIPSGYDVHHKDGDKLNNRIRNLGLVKHSEHKGIHAGFVCVNGQWVRPCADCGELIDRHATRKKRCRLCYNLYMCKYRRKNGISTMRTKGGKVAYVNHGPGWQSKRRQHA